jgi:hypothetical protein
MRIDPFDYASYTLAELEDAQHHINPVLHPDRAAQLEAELGRRQGVGSDPEARVPLWPLAALGVFLLVIAGIVAAVVVPKALAQKRIIESVQTAVTEQFETETLVTAEINPIQVERPSDDDAVKQKPRPPRWELSLLLAESPWLERTREERKGHALDVARFAHTAWTGEQKVSSVVVRYKRQEGSRKPAERFQFDAKELKESISDGRTSWELQATIRL